MAIKILTEAAVAADTGRVAADASLQERAVHALRQVMDPELPLNIYDLGLIYDLRLDEAARKAHVVMTLTAPNCPVAEELPQQVQAAVAAATGYTTTLELTFDPPWDKANLSLEAKLALGLL